jgi:hypothetical protein
VTDLPTTIMCPRCHQNPASDIYGPCTDCRTQLRDQADTVVCDETQRPQPLDQDPPVECPGQTDLFGGEAA